MEKNINSFYIDTKNTNASTYKESKIGIVNTQFHVRGDESYTKTFWHNAMTKDDLKYIPEQYLHFDKIVYYGDTLHKNRLLFNDNWTPGFRISPGRTLYKNEQNEKEYTEKYINRPENDETLADFYWRTYTEDKVDKLELRRNLWKRDNDPNNYNANKSFEKILSKWEDDVIFSAKRKVKMTNLDGIVAHYKFDEIGGETAYDSSGFGKSFIFKL